MTERERIEALLKRKKPDRVPILPFVSAISFSGHYSKLSIAEAYNSPEKSLAAQRKTARDFGWPVIPFFSRIHLSDMLLHPVFPIIFAPIFHLIYGATTKQSGIHLVKNKNLIVFPEAPMVLHLPENKDLLL